MRVGPTSFSLRSKASVTSVFPNFSVAGMDPEIEKEIKALSWHSIMIFHIQETNPKNNRRTEKLLESNSRELVLNPL